MALLSEVAKDKGRGILVVTHDHRTLSYADRLIRIEDGKIVGRARRRGKAADGSTRPPEDRAALRHPFTFVYPVRCRTVDDSRESAHRSCKSPYCGRAIGR